MLGGKVCDGEGAEEIEEVRDRKLLPELYVAHATFFSGGWQQALFVAHFRRITMSIELLTGSMCL
jgi:hypothetical protein